MTVSRYNDELSIDAALTSADDWTQVWTNAIPAAPQAVTYDFNRVGFLAGNSLNADRITFSNIDVTAAPIETLTLQVHTAGPEAGKMVLRNNRPQVFEIEYYEIFSNAGSLNSDGWTSLDAQEGDDEELEGWEEAAGNGATLLSEYHLFSTLTLGPDSWLSLGKAFGAGGNEDLKFFVGLADGTYLRGVVEYLSDGLTGDFNRDDSVDAADYVVWRKGVGQGFIDDDYELWRGNFNASGGSGASYANVPEPACLWLPLLSLFLAGRSGATSPRQG
jgi:hypothetical protein